MAFILTLCLCAADVVCPADGGGTVQAADTTEKTSKDGRYIYRELEDGTLEIISYEGESPRVAFPEILEGKTVTSIGSCTIGNYRNVTSISIPSSVTSISGRAFLSRTTATITVDSGNPCFSTDNNMLYDIGKTKVLFCPQMKEGEIVLPSSVTSIGWSAFWSCSHLTNIVIPESVTSIGSDAFMYCENLTSITIPKSVTSIGTSAFEECKNLTSITLPGSLDFMGEYQTFANCPQLKNVVIPSGITYIGEIMFFNCTALTSVTIPSSVTEIQWRAFDNCSSLQDVYYTGTKEQWKDVSINLYSNGNDALLAATIHFADGTTSKDPEPVPEQTQEPTSAGISMSSKNIQLSKTSLIYNGKAQKPAIIVKDGRGNVIGSKNYTLKYANNKNVGQATVTVSFKGNYKGTVKKTFNIVPKGTSISKITAKKKGFSLKWKKQTIQTTGYEIQYSTSSKFKSPKTVKNIRPKTASKNISKLKADKKYYVRIRTYKTVKGKKYYSDWSNTYHIRTKK